MIAPVPIRIRTKADVMDMLLDTMSAILEALSKTHTVDSTIAQVEIGFLQVSTEAAKVYLDNCDTVSIEPDEFEKQLKKLISNLHKATNSDNKDQVEDEISKINAILETYRQCKKGVSA